jgi:hypothetical protein
LNVPRPDVIERRAALPLDDRRQLPATKHGVGKAAAVQEGLARTEWKLEDGVGVDDVGIVVDRIALVQLGRRCRGTARCGSGCRADRVGSRWLNV